jgi:hypothetical protein
MLDCTITGISQDMDLTRNVTTTFLVLRLPDGKTLRAAINDTAAAQIVALSVAQNGEPTAAMELPAAQYEQAASTPFADGAAIAPTIQNGQLHSVPDWPPGSLEPVELTPEPGMRIFGGGQDGGDAPNHDYDPPAPAPTPPVAARSNVQHLPNGKIVVPSRTVPKNEFGYPVVRNNGVSTESILGGSNQDEDGVGSV